MNVRTENIDWQRLAARTRENFHVLSPVLPAHYRSGFKAIYAVCRIADDLGDAPTAADEPPSSESRHCALVRLQQFRERFVQATLGKIDHSDPLASLWAQLLGLIEREQIRPAHIHDLIDAFERDQFQLRYTTWDDLLSYCRKSADPVGRMVLGLGGIKDTDQSYAELIAHSDRICTALQLINHVQDVRRDLLERDRVYVPQSETKLSAADLQDLIDHPDDPARRVRCIRAMRPLVEQTRQLFIESEPIFGLLKRSPASDLAKTIWLFRAGGIALCKRIEQTGCTTLYRRPVTRKLNRLVLLLRACVQ